MRKSARNQPLPIEEVAVLRSLAGYHLKARCRALFDAGWTLSAIGAPLGKQRSTIRLWVTSVDLEPGVSVPAPVDKTYVSKKEPSPGLSEFELRRIGELAPQARKFRSKLPDSHPATRANYELTAMCMELHDRHVTIQELATAAGVTYRAMYRRIKNNELS